MPTKAKGRVVTVYTTLQSKKWNKSKHAQKCIACAGDFVKGDCVLEDVAVTLHARCIGLYFKQCVEDGLVKFRRKL